MKQLTNIFLTGLLISCFSCISAEQNNCIDPDKIQPDALCTQQYDPVCGCDGRTYGNSCEAENAGVVSYKKGACAE